MYHGQITTSLDFDFTKSVDSNDFGREVMAVENLDVERFRQDLQTLRLRLIDNASLKKIEYTISGQVCGGRFEADRNVKVPLNTVFPDASKEIIVGYDFVADAFEDRNGILTGSGKVNVKLRNYKEPKIEREFGMDTPIAIGGHSSVKCGLIGRIGYCGTSDEGTRIVRGVYDVLHRYDSDFENKRRGITPEVQANIAQMLKEEQSQGPVNMEWIMDQERLNSTKK